MKTSNPASLRLIIFGDSIALGVESRKSWPQYLLEHFPVPFQLYNLSISGEITEQLKERALSEFYRRYRKGRTIAVIQHGHNDFWETTDRKPSPARTLRNFSFVLRNLPSPVLCVSPVFIPPHKKNHRFYNSQLLELFTEMFEKYCTARGIPFVDVFKAFPVNSRYYTESWHLTEKANQIIANKVKDTLMHLLRS